MGSHQVEGTQRCAEASHNASRHFRGLPTAIGSGDQLALPATSGHTPPRLIAVVPQQESGNLRECWRGQGRAPKWRHSLLPKLQRKLVASSGLCKRKSLGCDTFMPLFFQYAGGYLYSITKSLSAPSLQVLQDSSLRRLPTFDKLAAKRLNWIALPVSKAILTSSRPIAGLAPPNSSSIA